jgi:hypothetical protein
MEDYVVQDNRTFINNLEYQNPRLESSTSWELQEWITSPSSGFFWISRVFTIDYPSPLSVVAANIVEMATNMQLPVCAFFCSWPADYPGKDLQEKEAACVVDLLYSLIRQLVDLLPSEFECQHNSDPKLERLPNLDGLEDPEVWTTSIDMLRNILSSIQQPVLIILDGIEHLDQTSVSDLANEVLGTLGEAVTNKISEIGNLKEDKSTSKYALKALVTTAGDCNTLLDLEENMTEACFVRVMEQNDAKRRGRRLR